MTRHLLNCISVEWFSNSSRMFQVDWLVRCVWESLKPLTNNWHYSFNRNSTLQYPWLGLAVKIQICVSLLLPLSLFRVREIVWNLILRIQWVFIWVRSWLSYAYNKLNACSRYKLYHFLLKASIIISFILFFNLIWRSFSSNQRQ